MHHADRLDFVVFILSQPRLDAVGFRPAAPVAFEKLRLPPDLARPLVPERREMPGLEHQYLVARRQRVDQRRLPRARAGGWEDEDMLLRLEDGLHAIEGLLAHFGEIGSAMVDGLLADGLEDAVGNRAWPRNLQEMSASLAHRIWSSLERR